MLHDFLTENRTRIAIRCRAAANKRQGARHASDRFDQDAFLTQVIDVLQRNEPDSASSIERVERTIGARAAYSGQAFFEDGASVDDVVRGYGDVCQAITGMAHEARMDITAREFQFLNRCLDDAISGAVSSYAGQREAARALRDAATAMQRMGVLAHEIRNLLATAVLAQGAVRAGLGAAAGAMVDRSLGALSRLVDQALEEVRLGMPAQAAPARIELGGLIAQLQVVAMLAAQAHGVRFRVAPVPPNVEVEGDRDALVGAITNLLQNAFKFTRRGSEVVLETRVAGDDVVLEVRDQCGGLPPGVAATMFRPFSQGSADRTGLGLGLAICRRTAEDHGGTLHVQDQPGEGCVMVMTLPAVHPVPPRGAA